ncbi:MAG: L-seryl-tRNA(Sec) selenium transferase [Sciscionella sp.]
MSDPRRRIPRTDLLLAEPALELAAARLGELVVKEAVQRAQRRARAGAIEPEAVLAAALDGLPASATGLREVLNATGVLVHTNLGRAPLSTAAIEAIGAAAGYTDVEFDLDNGGRGPRGAGALAALAARVPQAQAVHVVNNNAAALMLCALALAGLGREILISRGELVEIGDGFRIPDLLAGTGARLREVGTTNRTSVADYRDAIGQQTGFLLKVHPSNFRITGFTSGAAVAELAALGPPVVCDIGSGLLAPEPLLPSEPDARSALTEGAAVVTASGDKLLGGPQCGLILGAEQIVRTLRRHPIARALRVDKLTLAALEATLRGPEVPVQAAMHAAREQLLGRARTLVGQLCRAGLDAAAVDTEARVGGGGAPGVPLPSAAVSLPAAFAARLRAGAPPVIGRILGGRCLLDLRTVPPGEDKRLRDAVLACR